MTLRALLVLALSAPLAAQATWTVDDDGPADFTTLQLAVDFAADGDTILVRSGFYSLTVIDGEGLVIQGEGSVVLQNFLAQSPTLEIRNLAAGQAVHLRGLELDAFAGAEVTTLVVANCAGPVLLEDCLVNGVGTPVSVQNCASATFSRCKLEAPPTFASFSPFFFFGFAPYVGLGATGSNVFLYDCLVQGSSGAAAYTLFLEIAPAPSAAAVALTTSTLFAVGSTLSGGSGGGDPLGLCWPGADGSPGLSVASGSVAHLQDCTVLGGAGGAGGCGHPDGSDAQDIDVVSGEVHHLSGAARAFHGTSPIVEGTATNVHLEGEPGDAALLHVQLAAAPALFFPQYGAALHLPFGFAVVPLGVLPPSGVLDLPFPVPALPPGLESFRAVGQVLFVGASGGFFEGGPSTLLILDAAL